MIIDELAARFDNRTGYRLVAYGLVGLPVFRLTTVALCLEEKGFPPVDEFILRGVASGLNTVSDVAGLLGLDTAVVENSLAQLLRDDFVRVSRLSDGDVEIAITGKGQDAAAQHERVIPSVQTIVFWVDGLTRAPTYYPSESLYKPRELRKAGIPEVRAFPARPPRLEEIDIRDVVEVLRIATGRAESPLQLLRIESIERRDRVFLDAVAFAYRAEVGGDIQVDFAIDGRLSREHSRAFARAGGLEKTKLFRGLFDKVEVPTLASVLGGSMSKQLKGGAGSEAQGEGLQRAARVARARSIEATREPTATEGGGASELQAIQAQLAELPVRPLAVYEHPPLLRDALESASNRVLIISPWIRSAVVDQYFVKSLRAAISRGVEVFIGYGLGDKDAGERDSDKKARRQLEKIAQSNARFHLERTGDTHAKVLIKDRDFFVISSFNWLSFRGDPHRTFREEWGTKVSIPSVVDEYFREMVSRFHE